MKIHDDRIEVETAPADAIHGAKPEPEERPARRVMDTVADVGYGAGVNTSGQPDTSLDFLKEKGIAPKMKSQIVAESTVEEITKSATMCASCKHFDNAAWVKEFEKMRQSKDPFIIQQLEQYRAQLANAKGQFRQTGAGDVDASLRVMGLCKAYTRLFTDMGMANKTTYVHPMGVCPGKVFDPKGKHHGAPLPKLYKERKGMMQSLKDRVFGISNKASKRG